MKKALLLGTSALVAVGLYAGSASASQSTLATGTESPEQGLKVQLGGYMNQWFSYGNNSNSGAKLQQFAQWSDTEIFFKGEYKMENGLTVGIHVGLVGNTSADQIDQSYSYLKGDFGQVLLGSNYGAGYLMQVSAPNVGLSLNSGNLSNVIANPTGVAENLTTLGSTYIEPGNDNTGQKVTYLTPRFSGFQAGISYLPVIDNGMGGTTGGGDTNALVSRKGVFHDGFEGGVGYKNQMDNVDVALAGGYYYAKGPDVPGTKNFDGYTLGANLGYNGWTLGGSWARESQGGASLPVNTDGRSFDLGVAYEIGAWGVSADYFNGRVRGTAAPGDDKNTDYSANASYKLGDGVRAVGSVGYAKLTGDGGAPTDNKGVFVAAGLTINM